MSKRTTAEVRCRNAACGWHNQRNVRLDGNGCRLLPTAPCPRCGESVSWVGDGPQRRMAAEAAKMPQDGQATTDGPPAAQPADDALAGRGGAAAGTVANGRHANGSASHPLGNELPKNGESSPPASVEATDHRTGETFRWPLTRIAVAGGGEALVTIPRSGRPVTGDGVRALLSAAGLTPAAYALAHGLADASVGRACREGLDDEGLALMLRRLGRTGA